MTIEVQLRDSSAEAYQLQQLKVFELKERCPIETMFTAEHAKNGIEFDPAVWKPMELQKFLIHAIMHAAYVRGNAWSTVRQMLYAVRHYNVRYQGYDILKGKARLWQSMDLKKCKGPKPGKCPVTRAMLLDIMRGLDHAHDEDELRIWGSILLAFRFMLRSMDCCVKLEGGTFDLDNVLRVCDLIFKRDGKVIRSDYKQADEMLAILGRVKCIKGGEVRLHHRSAVTDQILCVVQTMGRLYKKLQYGDKNRPLFTWSRGSKSKSTHQSPVFFVFRLPGQETKSIRLCNKNYLNAPFQSFKFGRTLASTQIMRWSKVASKSDDMADLEACHKAIGPYRATLWQQKCASCMRTMAIRAPSKWCLVIVS